MPVAADDKQVPTDMVDWNGRKGAVMKRTDKGECIALVNNQCSIYEARPEVCRKFERGGRLCAVARNRGGK